MHDGRGSDAHMAGAPERRPSAAEVLAHLQAAALEVIAALRAVLDLAEDAVRDPAALAARARRARDRAHHDEKEGGGGVQRIPVS